MSDSRLTANNGPEQAELLFQLALAIGSSLELQPMLREACTALSRGLNAYGVQVWQLASAHSEPESSAQQQSSPLTWQPIFSMPRVLPGLPELQQYLSLHPWPLATDPINEAAATGPQVTWQSAYSFHRFELPDFGGLILIRKGEPLAQGLCFSVQVLMNKLAQAAKACLNDQALREQYQLLVAASDAKSRFMATMSHEFRTPLNAIVGLTELLNHTPLSSEQQHSLAQIRLASQGLLRMVEEILDFSKLVSERVQLERAPFSLSELLQQTQALFAHQAQEKGLDFRVHWDHPLEEHVLGDAFRLSQVLTNLTSNALKFTESGEVSLNVHTLEQEEYPLVLAFEVRDTGLGMTPEQSQQVFEAFHQADNSITRRYGGTGLGLSICKELIELMGSELVLESVPGQGSCFRFQLRFERQALASTHAALDPVRAGCWPGKRVLVVDDSELNQLVIGQYLILAEVAFEVAANGQAALDALAQQPFDLVLMDLHMPLLGGLETTERIRQQPKYRDLVIVALTASVSSEDQAACEQAGMQDFLAKPIDSQRLWQCLKRWLGAPPQPSVSMATTLAAPAVVGHDYSSQVVLDLVCLQNLAHQLGAESLRPLLLLFIDSSEQVFTDLEQALHKRDYALIRRLAHSSKSSAATVGAMQISTLARVLEQAAGHAKPNLARTEFLCQQLRVLWPAAKAAVTEYLGSLE